MLWKDGDISFGSHPSRHVLVRKNAFISHHPLPLYRLLALKLDYLDLRPMSCLIKLYNNAYTSLFHIQDTFYRCNIFLPSQVNSFTFVRLIGISKDMLYSLYVSGIRNYLNVDSWFTLPVRLHSIVHMNAFTQCCQHRLTMLS